MLETTTLQTRVSVKEFVEKYDISKDLVYVKFGKGYEFIKKVDGKVWVYERQIFKRKEFKDFVWNDTINLINELSETRTLSSIAKELHSYYGGNLITWQNYLYGRIYVTGTSTSFSVLHYKVPKTLWKTWRYIRWLKRRTNGLNSVLVDSN